MSRVRFAPGPPLEPRWHELAERGITVRGDLPAIDTNLDELLAFTRRNLDTFWRGIPEQVDDGDVAELGAHDANDLLLEDYLSIGLTFDEDPGPHPWQKAALHGSGIEIEFDFGYAPGFLHDVKNVARIAAGLAEEGWPADEEQIPAAVTNFYASAAAQGRAVVGGIG